MTLSDKAVARHEDDRLDRLPMVEKLVGALVRGESEGTRATEVVLGLTGPWGLGKSSVLNLLAEKLWLMANVAVVNFNPWLVGGRDDLLLSLLDEMQIQLGRADEQFARTVAQAIHRYRKVLAPAAALIPGVGGAVAEAIKGMPDRAARSPTEERKNVEKALRDAKGAVVVLIDEFDRLEPAEMKAMGQAIKAAMDLPNISWVIALDSERVTHVLRGEDRDWALGFIAKVITVNIPLRPLTDDEKARLLEQYLTEAGVGEPILQSELYPVVRGHLLPVLRTPRDIKRTVATYATMYRMVGWAVFSCDVLGWAALGAIRPDLQRKVSENLGDLCFGGERTANVLEQIFGEDNEQRAWEENVGIQGKDSIRGLLEFLFPKNSTPTYSHIYGRIQFYPNAWNLLWLGNGPFTWSVDQIKHLWSEPERFVSEEVERSDNISNLLEDTFRLLPDLDPKGDLAFMHFAIGRCKASNLAVRDLTEHFLRQVNRDPDLKARMRAVFGQLRAKDDLVLVPALVRGQAGRHGLRGHKANKTEPEFLSAAENG